MADEVAGYRENLFEMLTKFDDKDAITTLYLEGRRDFRCAAVRQLIREQTLARQIQPVFVRFGAGAHRHSAAMDAVTFYLPTPLDRPPVVGKHPGQEGQGRGPQARSQGADVGPCVQDRGPTSMRFILFTHLFGDTKGEQPRVEPGAEGEGVREQIFSRARRPQSPRGSPRRLRGGTSSPSVGPKDSIHPAIPCAIRKPGCAGADSIRRVRSSACRSSRNRRPTRDKLVDALNRLKREDPTFTWRVEKETGQTQMNGNGRLASGRSRSTAWSGISASKSQVRNRW